MTGIGYIKVRAQLIKECTFKQIRVWLIKFYFQLSLNLTFACSRRMILMKNSSSCLTFPYCPNVVTLPHCAIFTKIVNNLCSSLNPYQPHPRVTLRNRNSLALDHPFCRLTLSQRFFFPYASSLRNYLPEEIVQCRSLSSFKVTIHSHLL